MTQTQPLGGRGVANDNKPKAEVVQLPKPTALSYALGPHWFAVYTNIKSENRACAGLNAIGFRTYLPFVRKWISHARTRRVVQRPLMCRYIFVEADPNKQSLEDIRRVDGVEALVGNNGMPMIIPRAFVEAMICRQLSGEFDDFEKDPMTKGAKVRVVEGEWDNAIGVITGGSTANGGAVMVKLLSERFEKRVRGYAVRAYMGEAVKADENTA